jgi:hypothetical protein
MAHRIGDLPTPHADRTPSGMPVSCVPDGPYAGLDAIGHAGPHITEATGAPFQIDFRALRTHMSIFPPLRALCAGMMWERPLVEGQRVEFIPSNQLTERSPP